MPTSKNVNPLAAARKHIDDRALRIADEVMPPSVSGGQHDLVRTLIAAALVITKRRDQSMDRAAAARLLERPRLIEAGEWRSLADSPFDVIARAGSMMLLSDEPTRASALATAHHSLTATPTH